jgi:hypothetical protein
VAARITRPLLAGLFREAQVSEDSLTGGQ